MTLTLQVAIDCHDPHLLNRFWAHITGYEIEHHDAQIRELLAAGIASADDTIEADGELWWKEA
ncbi:MAG: VOC family protein, partial [Actinomycetota bacterium]|nr:VOC family protein [Actinomycetota bacterium]